MAKRDEEGVFIAGEHYVESLGTYLPPFPETELIRSALSGVSPISIEAGRHAFFPWIDFTLEHPDEIREIEGPDETTIYHYYNFVHQYAEVPAFVVEVYASDEGPRVNGFSLVLSEHELGEIRASNLVYCRTVEWEREKLVRTLNEQALLKYEDDSLDEARELIDNAISFSGGNAAYLFNNRGLICWKMGSTDQAKKDFLESISLEPTNGDPYFNMGLIYFDESDYDRALHYLQRAVETNPVDVQFLTELGHLYLELEQEDEALKLFRQAVQSNPDDPQVDFHLGHYFLYKKQKPRNAVKFYGQGLKKDPEDQFAMADLAVAHWVLGNRRKSLALHRILQSKNRLMPYTMSRLVYLNVEMADYENALKYYHQAISQGEPFEPEWLHYNAALVYAKTGRPKQALVTLDLAVRVGGEAVIKRALSDTALRDLKSTAGFKRLLRSTGKRKNK